MAGDAEGEDVTDVRGVPPVQIPSSVFQNYGEVEEDDPYRYYQPNYPAPQPVSPDDPALAQDDYELRSSDAYRSTRSIKVEGEEVGSKRRIKRGVKNFPKLTNWEEGAGGQRDACCLWLDGLEPLWTNQQVPDVGGFLWTSEMEREGKWGWEKLIYAIELTSREQIYLVLLILFRSS